MQRPSIQTATSEFINNLQSEGFRSTVATILSTAAKLQSAATSKNQCQFCFAMYQPKLHNQRLVLIWYTFYFFIKSILLFLLAFIFLSCPGRWLFDSSNAKRLKQVIVMRVELGLFQACHVKPFSSYNLLRFFVCMWGGGGRGGGVILIWKEITPFGFFWVVLKHSLIIRKCCSAKFFCLIRSSYFVGCSIAAIGESVSTCRGTLDVMQFGELTGASV